MPAFRVVLVEPRHEGNIGAVARLTANFGVKELVLVRPAASLGPEAFKRAMHGGPLLANAQIVGSLDKALEEVDFVVGTSGIISESEKRFLRRAVGPEEAARRLESLRGRVALLFGREDFGLSNEDLARCDMLVSIPTSPAYPVLNISHAVAILLYALVAARKPFRSARPAGGEEKEKLHEFFAALLDRIDYPSHKRAKTRIMFRRLVGRAVPSKWEFHTLMGVFDRATQRAELAKALSRRRRRQRASAGTVRARGRTARRRRARRR